MYDEQPQLTKAEWLSVLKLSTKWFFNDLRRLAISNLPSSTTGAIDLICLAKEYRVHDWLLAGYERVVDRLVSPTFFSLLQGTLSAQEGKRIGMEVALELSGIAIRQLRSGGDTIAPDIRKNNILEAFKEEFDRIQQDERQFMTRAEAEKKSRQLMEESVEQPPTGKKQKSKKIKKGRSTMKDAVEDNQNVKEEQVEGGNTTSPEQLHEESEGSKEDVMGRLDMGYSRQLEEMKRVDEDKRKMAEEHEMKRVDEEEQNRTKKRLEEAAAREMKKSQEDEMRRLAEEAAKEVEERKVRLQVERDNAWRQAFGLPPITNLCDAGKK
jgi:hypothetical protein